MENEAKQLAMEEVKRKRHLRYMAKREEYIAYQRAYYQANKEKVKGYYRRRVAKEREEQRARMKAALAKASIRAF